MSQGRTRIFLHGLLASKRGDGVAPVRLARQALRFVNDLAGRPVCSAEELARRAQAVAEAEALAAEAQARRGQGAAQEGQAAQKGRKGEASAPAPVVVYVTDQDHRTPQRIAEVLKGRDVPFQVCDVTDDEASRSWAQTAAGGQEFPLVFIAGEPVGGLHELTQLDVRGELVKKVFEKTRT
jgi:glutaredoxin